MAKVKGKFITFAETLKTLYKEQKEKADQALYAKCGKHFEEPEPEGLYDTKLIDFVFNAYANASPTG